MNNLFRKLGTMSSQKALFFGLCLTGLWYFSLFDDGSAVSAKIADIQVKMKVEKAKEAESDAALSEIAAVQASVGALSDQFKLVSAQLPSDIEMAEIIRTVDKVSQATGLVVKEKEPKPSIQHDVIEVMPLRVQAEGTFGELTMFFYYLSTIERIVRVKSFTITGPTEMKKGASNKLRLDANIASYKFLPLEASKPVLEGPKK